MLQIAICEDVMEQALAAEKLIHSSVPDLIPDVRSFRSAEAMLEAVEAYAYHPAVAVLDIELSGENGIHLAAQLNRLVPDCAIVYLTAYLQYAPEVYSTRHVYYVMKQDAPERLGPAIRKALEERKQDDCLCFRTAAGLRFARCRDILYLERILHKTRIQLRNEECLTAAARGQRRRKGCSLPSPIFCAYAHNLGVSLLRFPEKHDKMNKDATIYKKGESAS